MTGKDAPDVAVQLFALLQRPVDRNRERDIAIGHAVGFQFHQRIAQAVRFRRRCRVHHGGGGALGLLHVRRHRIAFREVMALRPADLPPGGFEPLRPPFQRGGHRGVHPVEVPQEVGVGGGGGREQGIEDQGFAIEPEVAAFGLEFRNGQPPVHPAPGRPVPEGAGPVHELAQDT